MRWLSALFGTISCGIETVEDRVRGVWLWKMPGKVRLLAAEEETIRGAENPSEATRRLLSRAAVKAPYANIRIPVPWVRVQVVQIPASSSEALDAALLREASQKLPAGALISKMLVSRHVLERNDSGSSVLMALCPAIAYGNAAKSIDEAGLRVGQAGAGNLDAFLSFAFEKDFLEKTLCYCMCEDSGIQAVVARQGALRHAGFFISPEPASKSGRVVAFDGLSAMCSDWELAEKTKIEEVVLAGSRAKEYLGCSKSLMRRIRLGAPLNGIKPIPKGLDPTYATAAGLAVKGLYPFLNTLNLMPAADRISHKAWMEKNRTLRFILTAGGVLCLLLAALNLFRFSLQKRMDSAEARMLTMSDRVTVVESIGREKSRLERRLSEIKQFSRRSGGTVFFLETLGKLVPPRLWLQDVQVGMGFGKASSAVGDSVLSIEGLAFDEQSLTVFLSRLETTPNFRPVRLIGSTRIPTEEAERMTGNRIRSALIRFTIACSLPHLDNGPFRSKGLRRGVKDSS
jgi:Tfp pilus assembly protein PilN